MADGSSRGRFSELAGSEPYPGVRRRSFDSASMTVTEYRFEPGATFPLHTHRSEQVTLIEEGMVQVTAGETVTELSAGDWSVIDSSVVHGMTAGPEGARFVAIVSPRRSDDDPPREARRA